MTDSPSKQLPPYGLRIPLDLKESIQKAAKDNNRSMHAEIIARLERTFAESADLDGFDVQQEVKRHHAWMVMMMSVLSKSEDKSFDPIRNVLEGMDAVGKKAAAQWFFDNELKPDDVPPALKGLRR